MAFANKIKVPFTVYGGVSTGDNGAVNTLSGYTNRLTPFQVVADTTAEPFNYLSNDLFMWDFGDGTSVKSSSAEHVYKYPGHYIVSLVAYDSAGNEYLSTQTKRLSVTDFLADTLEHVNNDVISIKNLPTGFELSKNEPITVKLTGSTHTHHQLSGSGYTLNLFVSGTDSRMLPLSSNDKWQHLDNNWSFYKTVTADNGTILYDTVNSMPVTVEPLYYEVGQKFGTPFYRRVPLSAVDAGESTTAVFVGVSGSAEYVYGDDTPKHAEGPVFLFTTLDITNHSDYREIVTGVVESDINADIKLPSIHQNFSLVIPLRIRHRPAAEITFTSSGIKSMIVNANKWQSTEIPFFVDLVDKDGVLTQTYQALSGKQAVSTVAEDTTINVVNLSAVSGSSDIFLETSLLSSNFYRIYDDQLPREIDGKFRGYFIPYETCAAGKLQGKVKLAEPAHFTKDVYVGSIGNGSTNEVNTMYIKDRYEYDDTAGGIIHNRTLEFVKTDLDDLPSPFCSSVIYETDRYSDNKVLNVWGGVYSNALSAVNTYTLAPSTLYLPTITDKVGKSVPLVTNTIVADYGCGITPSNLIPTRISFNKHRTAWITMSGGVFGMHADINVNGLLAGTIGEMTDVAKLSENESIEGKDSMAPAFIEAGKDSQFWVACSHPASGQVILSDATVGFDPTFGLANYNIRYVFDPKGLVPVDGVADNQGNLWVTTSNQQPELSWIRQTTQTVSARAMSDDTIKYEYYTGIDNVASNYVLYLSGFSNDFFNGRFLVKDVTDNVVTVKPYEGKVNNVPSTVLNEADIDSAIWADWVYKVKPDGTVATRVSGFFDPQFIVLDKYQNAWVGHDINTVTKVTTAGNIETNIKVFDTTFTNTYASAGTTHNYAMSADTCHLGGLSFDPYNNLLVINSFESKVYNIPTGSPTLSSSFVISNTLSPDDRPDRIFGHHVTRGDWTGYSWMNKYVNKFGISTIEGNVSLNVSSSAGKYTFAKINEDFDPIETIKSYRTQPVTINKGKVLFDDFYGSIVGSISSEPTALGRVIYEKIANFTDNVADVDTCNIPALYSLCGQHNFAPKNYNFNYPGGLGRVMDFVSIPHKKAWGSRSKFDRDFHNYGSNSGLYGKNLGDVIDTTTGVITAGTPIVIRQYYNNEYKKVMPMYVSGGASEPGYVSSLQMLSTYPLSSYNMSWGWGLGDTVTSETFGSYYKVYQHVEYYADVLSEGVIDWTNSYTNLVESQSGLENWNTSNGIVETLIDYELRSGLGLFNTTVSADNREIL